MAAVLVARCEVGQVGQASIRWAATAVLLLRAGIAAADPAEVKPEQPAVETRPLVRDRGFTVGLRAGYGFPFGLLAKGDDLSANVGGMVPIWLDGGYRLSREFYVGLFGSWGFGSVADSICPAAAGLRCSASDLRFGVNAHAHLGALLALAAPIDPWVGLGTGYEITTIHLEADGTTASETDRGFELANLQLGADYTGLGAVRVGGFFTLTLAEYSARSLENPAGSHDYTPDRAFHLWLMLGVRGRYDL